MLAKETGKPFDDKNWIYEIKWDGYRAIAEVNGGNVKLYSRNGNSFSDSYPELVEALSALNIDAVLDGEIVVLDENGIPSFQNLQHYNQDYPLIYYVFDLLFLNKKNVCDRPLLERKRLIKKIIKDNNHVKYCDHVKGKGVEFFELAVKNKLEGIIAKRADSEYFPGVRTANWLKIKNHKSTDVIIVGFTSPRGSRLYFGSLVLVLRNGNKFKYIGQAGTGFNDRTLKEVYGLLEPLITKKSILGKDETDMSFTPVKPVLVCEVKYSEITKDGKLRHPVFLRIRTDKMASNVKMDELQSIKDFLPGKQKRKKDGVVSTIVENSTSKKKETGEIVFGKIKVKISNWEKMFWPDEGITKGDVIEYYKSIADYILPYLKNRPESLNRNPNGILKTGFYHKDAGFDAPEWVDTRRIFSTSAGKEINYLLCNNAATLIYMANLACIELNPWHSTVDALDKPDYLVIDIDPSEKNTFDEVVETALLFKEIFDKAGADAYCKTSGATGMHIYVPMGKKYSYDQVKDFAHLICMLAQTKLPSITSLERSLVKRNKKHIYLDYLQNRRGQTIASAYCLRPKPGAPVSMPLKWSEVKKGLSPLDFTIHNALKRLKKMGDIFSGVLGKGIDMEKCIERLNKTQ